MASHLYVHIPFCRSRCAYCDFVSEAIGAHLRSGRVERYLETLRAELAERGGDSPLETVYVGGGTPTALPRDLLSPLLTEIGARLAPGGEFTIEANPGTLDTALLEELAEFGVTRLSLGVQSFSPELRAALGRQVKQQELAGSLESIARVAWKEWNLDLVFGIPGQNWELARDDLRAAADAGPAHISLYDLTYTAGYEDWLARNADAGARGVASAMAEAHYAEAVSLLEDAGYRRYEISNFALPGHECRHNRSYWRGEDYVGIGAGAVSTVGLERRTNPRSVEGYLVGETPETEVLTQELRVWERAMLGLRTADGIDEAEHGSVIDEQAKDRLLGQGCLERRYAKLRVNPGFLDVSNAVIGTLLTTPGIPER